MERSGSTGSLDYELSFLRGLRDKVLRRSILQKKLKVLGFLIPFEIQQLVLYETNQEVQCLNTTSRWLCVILKKNRKTMTKGKIVLP